MLEHQDTAPTPRHAGDIATIFERLQQGLGREMVTDENVDALIDCASKAGHRILEQELREWKASCG